MYDTVFEVSEDMIKDAAFICGSESSFISVLDQGQKFREAGLTPVYIYNMTEGSIRTICREKGQITLM